MTLQLPPLGILSVNSILGRCVALWNIPIHNEHLHTYSIQYRMHCFSSINTALIWKHSQFREVVNFRYFCHFFKWLHFICPKVILRNAKVSSIYARAFYSFFKLYRMTSVSREYVCAEFDCRRISVIVHRSASDKPAVDSFVLLV